MSKKTKKRSKRVTTRYAVEYPSDNPKDIVQRSCFTLVEVEYQKNEEYEDKLILPKKLDTIIRKTEKLGLCAVEIFTGNSLTSIKFIEDEGAFKYGGDMLNDLYESKQTNHVNFVWDYKQPSSPKTFELVFDINGTSAFPTNHPCFNLASLLNIVNMISDMKEYSRRLDIVYKEIKRNKKSKLKKYYTEKK